MRVQILTATDPKWVDPEHLRIDCFVTCAHTGDEVIPFTAVATDTEEHGRKLFQDLVDGVYGPIAEYTPPPPPTAEQIRALRAGLISQTDWTQAADVPQALKDKWAPYRQALRDVPEQSGFPENVIWPTPPQ